MKYSVLLEEFRTSTRIIIYGSLIGFLISILFITILVLILSQPKGRPHCPDFGSRVEAQAAFLKGDFYLDANHNGKACETTTYHD